MKSNPCLQFYQTDDVTILNAYDRVVFNLVELQKNKGYKTFLFGGCSPRVGTTSIVIQLAIIMANLKKKVLILDGDYRRKTSSKRLSDIAKIGMADFVKDPNITLEQCIYPSNVEGLYYFPSGDMSQQKAQKILYSPQFKSALNSVSEQFDIVLIDSCAMDTTTDVLTLACDVDAVVLVCALDSTPKRKLQAAYQQISAIDCNLIGVIENKVKLDEYANYMNNFDYYTGK